MRKLIDERDKLLIIFCSTGNLWALEPRHTKPGMLTLMIASDLHLARGQDN